MSSLVITSNITENGKLEWKKLYTNTRLLNTICIYLLEISKEITRQNIYGSYHKRGPKHFIRSFTVCAWWCGKPRYPISLKFLLDSIIGCSTAACLMSVAVQASKYLHKRWKILPAPLSAQNQLLKVRVLWKIEISNCARRILPVFGAVACILDSASLLVVIEMISGRLKLFEGEFPTSKTRGSGRITFFPLLLLVRLVFWSEMYQRSPRYMTMFTNIHVL